MNILLSAFLFNIVASFICFFAAIKMILVVKGEKRKSINIKYYLFSLFFISSYFFVSGIPLFFKESFYLMIVSDALFRPLLVLGGMFLTLITINLSKIKIIENIYFYLTLGVIFVSSILTISGISDLGNSYFTSMNIEKLMRPDSGLVMIGTLMVGVFFTLSLSLSLVFYIRFALKQKLNKVASGKAIMMTIGCFMFFGAGVSKYIVGAVISEFTLTSIIASFLFMMGSIAFAASVNYKGEKANYKN